MAGTTSMSGGGATVPRSMEESEVTGWVGWIVFAGTMMMLIGVFHAFQGLIALTRESTVAFPKSDIVLTLSYSSWGWMQLLAGVVVFFAGLGLFTGRMWARTIGVILVSLSALINFAWAPAFPIWSITLLAIDFLVLYAIIAHGGEMKAARET